MKGIFKLIAAVVFAAICCGPIKAEELTYDWSNDESAVESAKSIAQTCLDAGFTYQTRHPCAWKPNAICASQYNGGRQNQRDINTCSRFSALAWESILAAYYELLMKFPDAPKDIRKSHELWKAWSDFDCRTRADYIGTRSPMNFTACRTKHASDRVFEFMQMLGN